MHALCASMQTRALTCYYDEICIQVKLHATAAPLTPTTPSQAYKRNLLTKKRPLGISRENDVHEDEAEGEIQMRQAVPKGLISV